MLLILENCYGITLNTCQYIIYIFRSKYSIIQLLLNLRDFCNNIMKGVRLDAYVRMLTRCVMMSV